MPMIDILSFLIDPDQIVGMTPWKKCSLPNHDNLCSNPQPYVKSEHREPLPQYWEAQTEGPLGLDSQLIQIQL